MTDRAETERDTLYKALKTGGVSPYRGHEWPTPTRNGDGWEPGAWVEAGPGELVECGHGLHCCTIRQLPPWLEEELYVLEPAGGTDRLVCDDKTVVRKGRLVRPVETWTETTMRLFAADCAEMVLPIYEEERPDDDRPRQAIEVARRYARGEATEGERAAARGAAWAAARDATRALARAAARAAAPGTVRAAARAPAWATAWAAAPGTARAPARAAARDAAWAAISGRLALYLAHGEAASEEPVPDIREFIDE